MPEHIIKASFIIYALTFLFTTSYIFLPIRRKFRAFFWDHKMGFFYKLVKGGETQEPMMFNEHPTQDFDEVIGGHDFIACRMCIGVYVAGFLYFVTWGWLSWHDAFWSYACAYFLSKLERKDT